MNEITTIACGNANAYLVRGPGGAILIDTGTERFQKKVLDACGTDNVKLILLTHGHVDHCQNAAFLAEKLGCPAGIGAGDIPLLRDGRTRRVYGRGLIGTVYAMASNQIIEHQKFTSITPAVVLEEGMPLSPYGVEGKIVALPGHTAGSVGVLLDSGEFFVGDAMQNIGAPACAWCYEDREEAQRSTELIRTMGAVRIFYGHGTSTDGSHL